MKRQQCVAQVQELIKIQFSNFSLRKIFTFCIQHHRKL